MAHPWATIHPLISSAAHTAYGYIATITILVLRTALDNLARDFVCKRERSSLTNGICLALYRTRLSTLRRIDTEQSNPYAVYFDCVAVDNRCAATSRLRFGWRVSDSWRVSWVNT